MHISKLGKQYEPVLNLPIFESKQDFFELLIW